MNPFIFHDNFSLELNGRNPKSSHYSKRIFLKEKSKTISPSRRPPTTPNAQKPVPILSFPLFHSNKKASKNSSSKSLFLTSTNFYSPFLARSDKIIRTIVTNSTNYKYNYEMNKNNGISLKKKVESRFTKPVIIRKAIENKIKESKKKQKLKNLNILDFGNHLKLYDEIEKKQKEKAIIEKRNRELNDIYYDYDKSNRKKIMNSFSGNGADLLRNKVCFVKGIVDYLYPKIVLTKMEYINDLKDNNFKEGRKKMEENLKNKYYLTKHRNPEQTVAMSKFLYGGDLDIIRPKENIIDLKKTLINKCIVTKLAYKYDFI